MSGAAAPASGLAHRLEQLGEAWRVGPATLMALLAAHPELAVPGAQDAVEAQAAALWMRAAPEPRREDALAVGRCVAHLCALRALTLAPADGEPVLPSHPTLAAWLARSPVSLVSAGRVDGPLRVLELRAALGGRAGQVALGQRWAALHGAVPPGAFADHLDAGHAFLCSALRFTALAALARAPSPWAGDIDAPVRDGIEKGRAFIGDPGQARESWEHQRWGLADDPRPLVGRAYIQATILRCLRAAGAPTAAAQLRAHVSAQPAAPLRYYEDWERLPPDADSLGLFLLSAAEVGGASPAQLEAWRAPLAPSRRPDGTPPTWLVEGPDGPTTPEPRWTWGGDDCTASRSMLLLGLLAQARAADLADIARDLAGILDGWDAGRPGSFYYDTAWARVLLLRLLQHPGSQRLPPELRARLHTRVAHEADAAAARQAPDGGWGSPLQTAFHLETLAWRTPGAVAVHRGLRYLCDSQGPDGSWASEPFFLTIGKPPYPVHPHGGRVLTTALCIASAARALDARRPGSHGHH